MTESLTTDLSRIVGLFVVSRNTAFTYKDKALDLKQVGRDLNVRYVLQGSVQKGDDRSMPSSASQGVLVRFQPRAPRTFISAATNSKFTGFARRRRSRAD